MILKTWSNERASHQGKFWRFEPRPIQRPHLPIWVAGTSAEGVGWAGRNGYYIRTVGHPHPPEKVRPVLTHGGRVRARRVSTSKRNIANSTSVPTSTRTSTGLGEIAMAAISRYDTISRIGRRSLNTAPADDYDWATMLTTWRNNYGTPEQVIQGIHTAAKHYYFDTFTTTFNFSGILHGEIIRLMTLFARHGMPAFH